MRQWVTLFPLVLLVLPVVGIIAQYLKDRLRLRRAGVNAKRPGCPTCLYLVRGWTSSKCPECGTDVSAEGVVIGPTVSKVLVMVTMGIWGLAACGMIAFALCSHVFRQREWSISIAMQSVSSPGYEVTVQTTGTLGAFSASERVASQVVFRNRMVANELMIKPGEDLPTSEELTKAIRAVAVDQAPSQSEVQITEILSELRQQRGGRKTYSYSWQRGGFNLVSGPSTSQSTDVSPWGLMIAIVLTLTGTFFLVRLAGRLSPNGRCPVRDEEWVLPGD